MYENQIKRALRNAPDLPKRIPHTDNDLSALADEADNFMVPMNFNVKVAANEVMVSKPEDLKRLHEELCKIAEVDKQGYDIDATVKHESEHGRAAIKLGAHSVRYVFTLWGYENGIAFRPGAIARKLLTPKLGLAVLSSYPREPSTGDLMDIAAMGYEGVKEVGDRVKIFNKKVPSRDSLPLPLSYKR